MRIFWTKRRRVIFVVLVVGIACAVPGYFLLRKTTPAPTQTVAVEYADLESTVQATGTLLPFRKVDVGAQVNGQLQSLNVELGQHVRKGDLLASIDPTLAKNDLLGQDAALEQQSASLESRKIDLSAAERELVRQKTMSGADATTASDVEKAEVAVGKLQAEIRGLSAAIRQSRSQADTARAKLEYTRIVAPIEGEVISLPVQEGQTVNATQQVPTILTLAQLETMTVRARVPEADVARIRKGQKVYFTTLGDAKKRFYGTVRTIQPTPERIREALFYNALFEVPNKGGELWSDMTVQVAFVLEEHKHVLSIPVAALGKRESEGHYSVSVVSADGTTAERKVITGIDDRVRVEIKDGLKQGDKLVVTSTTEGGKP